MVFRIEITDVRDAGWGTGRRDQDPLTDPESRKWCFKLPFLLRLKFECATCQQIYTGLWRHSLLMTMADAPPPPLQMLARPRLPSGRLCVMWAINREPDILKIKQAVSLLPLGDAAVSLHCSSPLESEKKLHHVFTRAASEFLSQCYLRKKNSCKLKLPHPHPPPITFLMARPLSRISRTPQCVYKCLKCY